jgi:predicted Fe-Mo cluster-binding NifX family protein
MKTIAISIFGNRISSRLDMAEKLMIVSVDNMIIKNKEIYLLDSADILKKLDTLVKLKPDVLICGGLTNLCEKKLKNYNIKIIPWVRGETENILKLYLNGVLTGKNERILTRN